MGDEISLIKDQCLARSGRQLSEALPSAHQLTQPVLELALQDAKLPRQYFSRIEGAIATFIAASCAVLKAISPAPLLFGIRFARHIRRSHGTYENAHERPLFCRTGNIYREILSSVYMRLQVTLIAY